MVSFCEGLKQNQEANAYENGELAQAIFDKEERQHDSEALYPRFHHVAPSKRIRLRL